MRSLAVAVAMSLVAFAGCSSKSLEEREAERVIAAIDRIGRTPAAEREPLIAALEDGKAESPRVEKVRFECAAAYRALHTVQVSLGRTAEGDPFSAFQQLQAATSAGQEAKAAHERCKQAMADLRVALGATD